MQTPLAYVETHIIWGRSRSWGQHIRHNMFACSAAGLTRRVRCVRVHWVLSAMTSRPCCWPHCRWAVGSAWLHASMWYDAASHTRLCQVPGWQKPDQLCGCTLPTAASGSKHVASSQASRLFMRPTWFASGSQGTSAKYTFIPVAGIMQHACSALTVRLTFDHAAAVLAAAGDGG